MKKSSDYNTLETYQNTRKTESAKNFQCKSLNQNTVCLSPAYYNVDENSWVTLSTLSSAKQQNRLSPIMQIFSPQPVIVKQNL